jgi:hypothetical protein
VRPSRYPPHALLGAAVLVACGARTALPEIDASETDARPHPRDAGAERDAPIDAPRPSSCGAPDPPVPLVLSTDVQYFGNVAAAGCSFAMMWIEYRGPTLQGALVARTARVVDHAWTLSPEVKVADVSGTQSVATSSGLVAWDGSAYTIAWGDRGSLFLRRLGTDGVLLGPAVRIVGTELGPRLDGYVLWMDPSRGDATLRLALYDNEGGAHVGINFLRVTLDGTALAPAKVVTSSLPYLGLSGFAHLPTGGNLLLWSAAGPPGPPPPTMTLSESLFDDLGNLTAPTEPVLSAVYLDMQQPGSVSRVNALTYFGLEQEASDGGSSVLLGVLNESGPTYAPVPGVAAFPNSPALATTDTGVLGALSGGTQDGTVSSVLSLSYVVESRLMSTTEIAPADTADQVLAYAVAAGATSFGVFWFSVDAPLSFTVRTP